MNIHRYNISPMLLLLFPLAFICLTSFAQANTQLGANHSVQIDPMLTQLLNQKAQQHITKPVVASVLLKTNSTAVIEQIRHTGATVISRSKNYPLLTIGLESLKQLQALTHIDGIEQIHSIYPSVGDSEFAPQK